NTDATSIRRQIQAEEDLLESRCRKASPGPL
ncbi:MAG: hypothetical protein ACI8Y4_001624, partial [Candidatus Poriferisodalaceae bacterium]